jgi:hypothetical protein
MQNILNKLTRDKIVSFEVMEYIRTIFSGRTTGLPRGLNISASFAELYMREFDTKNKMFDRVGYFARYVDDIVLIFYTQDNLGVNSAKQKLDEKIRTIKEELKKIKLSINYKKTEAFYISQKGNMYTFTFLNVDGGRFIKSPKIKNNEIHFDYLGYRYIRKDAKVTIKIAKNKINKIKSRIYNSFLLFRYDNDYNLLEKRIRYLFSNHQIYGSDDNTLYTGIYYSYPQCDPDGKFLNSIEIFYRNILKEYRHSISSEKYKILKILSITAGYEKKIVENFSLKEIKKILSGLKHYE